MGDLKPLGSEKLTGQDKIKRIIELSRYNENRPSNLNESSRSEYSISLTDGNNYQIVKEKLGYIIKRTISESQTDYIEPIKNRKYYNSYSQALKRLNLLTKEVNRLTENENGTSLFGEQKKFVLKTPKSDKMDDSDAAVPPPAPPPVPTTDLPPSPMDTSIPPAPEGGDMEGGDMEGGDMEGGDMPPAPEGEDMGADVEGGEDFGDEGMGEKDKGEEVSFKTIQKLTGKLTQKIRVLDAQEGMTSENIKYVINMVLSSLDLSGLSEEDKEDIISKFDEQEFEGEDGSENFSDMGNEFGDTEEGGDVEPSSTEPPVDTELGESGHGAIFDSIFKESKIDKVISRYFEKTKKEILESEEKKVKRELKRKSELRKKINYVAEMTETIEQELAAKKFLQENNNFRFIGKTNLKNLIFENKNEQVKITPEGFIL